MHRTRVDNARPNHARRVNRYNFWLPPELLSTRDSC